MTYADNIITLQDSAHAAVREIGENNGGGWVFKLQQQGIDEQEWLLQASMCVDNLHYLRQHHVNLTQKITNAIVVLSAASNYTQGVRDASER